VGNRRPGALAKLAASAGFVRIVRNWPEHYAATHGRTRPARLVYHLRNGLALEARPRTLDVAVIKDVFWHRVYSPPGFAVEDGAVVVDVGAHIGAFAAFAARAAKDVAVLAFEPHPENFELLTSNLARNGLTQVRAQNCGVAGSKGSRDLHVSTNPAGHSLHIAEPGRNDAMPVPTVTLADVLAMHALPAIDLLKMDCEGAEYEILEAAVPDALRRVRRIAMEAHRLDGSRTPERLASLLESQGFRVRTQSKDDRTAMVWADRP